MPKVTQLLRDRVWVESGLLQILGRLCPAQGHLAGGQVGAEIQLTLHSPG